MGNYVTCGSNEAVIKYVLRHATGTGRGGFGPPFPTHTGCGDAAVAVGLSVLGPGLYGPGPLVEPDPLEGAQLDKGLYSTWFSYRKSPERKEAFVLSKEGGTFLLVGYAKNSPFVGQIVPYELFDAESADGDEEDEEMDFAMM